MKANNIPLFLFGLAALVISCTETNEPSEFEYSLMFSGETSKTWNLKSIAFRNEGDPEWKLDDPCWSDDRYIFYRDAERKFEFKTGSNKCDPSEDPFTLTDTWSFTNANATLYFIFPLLADFALPYTVKEIDKNDMVLEIYFNDAGSQSYRMKFESDDEN